MLLFFSKFLVLLLFDDFRLTCLMHRLSICAESQVLERGPLQVCVVGVYYLSNLLFPESSIHLINSIRKSTQSRDASMIHFARAVICVVGHCLLNTSSQRV